MNKIGFFLLTAPLNLVERLCRPRAAVQRGLLSLTLLAAMTTPVRAEDEKSITARLTENGITIDGRLDENDWARAEPVTDFVQSEPRENQPATETTEVRVLFDRQNLYFGIHCYDSEPDKIVISDLKRDFQDRENDVFIIAIDPQHDHRNAFAFFVNAGSAQLDIQSANDGRDVNRDWDGVWHAGAGIQSDGWTAEVAIPYKTLGVSSGSRPVMGVNFRRRIRRKNESVDWGLIPRRFLLTRVSLAGVLLGLGEVETGHNFRVKPFVTGGWTHRDTPSQSRNVYTGDAGVDVKYGVRHGLSLDLTYNTDFSQVEVDAEQINLTRFNLFFPEKRDFFLENAGRFQLGDVPRERGPSRGEDTQLFYSRRIGLSPAGRPLPILGGARLSGKAGDFALGLLNIHQRDGEGIPANNFTVVRVSRDLLANSDIGLMYVGREGERPADHNRSVGVDVNLQFRQKWTVNSFLAATSTPGLAGRNHQFKVSTKWDNGVWEAQGIYAEIGENFNPEIGFVPRRGVRNYQLNLGGRLRPKGNPLIREYYPHLNVKYFADRKDLTLDKDFHYSMQFFYRDGSDTHLSVNPQFERLLVPFRLRPDVVVPAGDYAYKEYRILQNSDRSRMLSGSAQIYWGGFYDGDITTLSLSGRLLIKPRLSTEFSYQHNDIDIRAGAFTADLYGWRFNYSFSPVMFADAFIQYNTSTHRILTNLRFSFRHRPLSDISVVLTEDRLSTLGIDTSRALIVKYTHMLQF